MATFKAEVYAHQKRGDGTYNIKIRVTHNKRKKYLSTVWYVTKDDLTRNTLKLKNKKYIDLTDELIKKYRDVCDRVGERLKDMTVEQVVDIVTHSEDKFELDIVSYTWQEIEAMRASGHAGNASSYVCAIRSLVKFAGRDKVMISEITARFLTDWAAWIGRQSNVTRGYATHNYLNRMRAIHNKAKREFNDEDAGIIRIPNSPFAHIEFPKLPVTRKIAITAEQLVALTKISYTNVYQRGTNRFNFAKDLFLLSFGLIGMNATDLYNCTDCKDGRITYKRMKTKNRRNDEAVMSVKIEPEIQPLVDKYRDPSGERVFNFYRMYGSVDTFTNAMNYGLKQIGELIGVDNLVSYAARHTWATIAANDVGIDKYTVHLALNHVDESMRVTDIYIRKSWDPIDRANRQVMDYLGLDVGDVTEP